MGTNTKKCPSCGAGMKAFWHHLSPPLVNSLIKAIRYVQGEGQNRFNANQDLGLTHNEAANFQKLRFHGLVAHADSNPRSGFWLITSRGGQFLRGEIAVPKRVQTFRNHVIGHERKEFVKISDYRGKVEEFEQEFAYEFQRPLVGARAPGAML